MEAIGFGASGVIKGSMAAGAQSMIGNVAAGSVFAICTSVGMTGGLSLLALGVQIYFIIRHSLYSYNMFGFGTEGIIAGSIAAAIQSSIGNVAARSAFAVCTSIGMGGAFPPLLGVAIAVLGLAMIGAVVWYFWNRSQ